MADKRIDKLSTAIGDGNRIECAEFIAVNSLAQLYCAMFASLSMAMLIWYWINDKRRSITMRCLYHVRWILLFLLSSIIASCGGGNGNNNTANDDPGSNDPIYSETAVTSNNGIVDTAIGQTNYEVSSVDSDTGLPIGSIDLVFEQFDAGILIWANDPLGRYEPNVRFIPSGGSDGDEAAIQPRFAKVTLIMGFIAIVNGLSDFHSLYVDPPRIATVKIKGMYNRCITGDVGAALSISGIGSSAKTLRKVFQVLTTKKNRGITAIQFGFETPNMISEAAFDVWKHNFATITGVEDTRGIYCWRTNVANDMLLMVAEIEESETEVGFELEGSFSVNSEMSTGINVNEGDTIRITATGSMYLGFFAGGSGPEGIEYGVGFNYYSNLNHGQLVGKIGDSAFGIGAGVTFKSEWAGTLRLLVNDNDPYNNSGHYQVNVEIHRANDP